jgi:hypothetical protein
MKDTELYQHLLGLSSPWHVERVDLDVKAQRVAVFAAHPKDATFMCPECGAPCPLHDHDEGKPVTADLHRRPARACNAAAPRALRYGCGAAQRCGMSSARRRAGQPASSFWNTSIRYSRVGTPRARQDCTRV